MSAELGGRPERAVVPRDGRQPGRGDIVREQRRDPLAEHTVLLMLMLSRNVPRWLHNQDE